MDHLNLFRARENWLWPLSSSYPARYTDHSFGLCIKGQRREGQPNQKGAKKRATVTDSSIIFIPLNFFFFFPLKNKIKMLLTFHRESEVVVVVCSKKVSCASQLQRCSPSPFRPSPIVAFDPALALFVCLLLPDSVEKPAFFLIPIVRAAGQPGPL